MRMQYPLTSSIATKVCSIPTVSPILPTSGYSFSSPQEDRRQGDVPHRIKFCAWRNSELPFVEDVLQSTENQQNQRIWEDDKEIQRHQSETSYAPTATAKAKDKETSIDPSAQGLGLEKA